MWPEGSSQLHGELTASPTYPAARGDGAQRCLSEQECLVRRLIPAATPRGAAGRGRCRRAEVRVRALQQQRAGTLREPCAGFGIAALPSIMTVSDIAAGRLVQVLPQYTRAGRGMNVIYPVARRPLAVSMFADMAVEASQQEWMPASGA